VGLSNVLSAAMGFVTALGFALLGLEVSAGLTTTAASEVCTLVLSGIGGIASVRSVCASTLRFGVKLHAIVRARRQARRRDRGETVSFFGAAIVGRDAADLLPAASAVAHAGEDASDVSTVELLLVPHAIGPAPRATGETPNCIVVDSSFGCPTHTEPDAHLAGVLGVDTDNDCDATLLLLGLHSASDPPNPENDTHDLTSRYTRHALDDSFGYAAGAQVARRHHNADDSDAMQYNELLTAGSGGVCAPPRNKKHE
jgi:hypothetical protein